MGWPSQTNKSITRSIVTFNISEKKALMNTLKSLVSQLITSLVSKQQQQERRPEENKTNNKKTKEERKIEQDQNVCKGIGKEQGKQRR